MIYYDWLVAKTNTSSDVLHQFPLHTPKTGRGWARKGGFIGCLIVSGSWSLDGSLPKPKPKTNPQDKQPVQISSIAIDTNSELCSIETKKAISLWELHVLAGFLSTRYKLVSSEKRETKMRECPSQDWPEGKACWSFSWLMINAGGLSPLWEVPPQASILGLCEKGS